VDAVRADHDISGCGIATLKRRDHLAGALLHANNTVACFYIADSIQEHIMQVSSVYVQIGGPEFFLYLCP
jgi:hypothetical protein